MSGPVAVAAFRARFPAFTEALFPDAEVSFYLNLANMQVNEDRWRDLFAEGQMLYAAHFLTLESRDRQAGTTAGGLGKVSGLVTSKSVGGVSLSYDLNQASNPDAGHWNLTTYGLRWWRFMRLAGAGGVQLY